MKKIKRKSFFENDQARIPFSVIGIFLILGSSFTAVYVTKLETETSENISSTIDFNEVESFLRLAEADMATALNLAGLKGLKEIGERPIIVVSNPDSNPYGKTADEVNTNRVKSIIKDEMNVYLNNTYRYEVFNNGRFAINVKIPEGFDCPIASRDEISFKTINMRLKRDFTVDLIGPPPDPRHTTYWVANIPVDIDIVQIDADSYGKLIINRTIEVSTIITCRYNLLKELVDEYQDEISGGPLDSGQNSLSVLCTALFNAYSLARGLQHWKTGKPANVVDNKGLQVIVNSGLLLQQGFVFGSVDPMALVEFATSIGGSSDDTKNKISGLNAGSLDLSFDTSDISGVLPEDDGSGVPTTDIAPDIDVEELASLPLYEVNSVILCFKNDATGDWINKTISNPSDAEIEQIGKDLLDQGYVLKDSKKNLADITKNQTTVNLIINIISTVYTAEMQLVVERGSNLIQTYESAGYTVDKTASPWVTSSYDFKGCIHKPGMGSVKPGCILYAEFYSLGSEDVLIKIILNEYSSYNGLKNDVKDVFYKNTALDDENLQDTVDKYKNQILTDQNLTSWIDDNNTGVKNTSKIEGSYNSWVETETWQALDQICNEIKKIKIDSSITIAEYPNPTDLLEAAKQNLLDKYNQNISLYLDESAYKDSSLFKSTGKKAVYCSRHWYVYHVQNSISSYYTNIQDMFNDYIDDALQSEGVTSINSAELQNALSDDIMNSIESQIVIPMGYDIWLFNEWDESIRIAVDQDPDYLDADKELTATAEETNNEEENFYSLKLKNTCVFGPLGFWILPPSPVTPWIITINVWIIEVKGEYKEFKVVDTTDETHFNPFIGHDAQIYVRKHQAIKQGSETIGENTRLNFDFATAAVSVVPGFQNMVGDTEGGYFEESKGWD